jgi:peptide/nickel transport system permease protein
LLSYIIRRLLIAIPMLFAVSVVVFALASLMPGDAVAAMISPDAPGSERLAEIRRGQLGLDRPVASQYFSWLGQVLRGNLGVSFITGDSVTATIGSRLTATLVLMGTSLLLSIVVGVVLGVISALRQYSITDYALTIFGFIGLSIPLFFLGLVLIYAFALRLDWFPTSGMVAPGQPKTIGSTLHHLVLPGISLGLLRIALFMRYTRASVLEVMRAEWVRTARAKGLRERSVVGWHIVRNALGPVATVVGLALPLLVSGAIVIEQVFQWPGLGLLLISAINQRDSPVIMGIVMMSAIVIIVANLLTDIAYALIDPRVRYD